jgi:predicted aldo/keto reductase-like oxidoreductase
MGTVGGGRLAGSSPESMIDLCSTGRSNFVDLAFKFVLNNPNVSVALSGMGSEDMLQDNLQLIDRDSYNKYIEDEESKINKIARKFKELSDNVCTGCGYCMPCPNGVNIKLIFNFLIRYQIYGVEEAKHYYDQIGKVRWAPGENADACEQCEECLEKCPQNIPIIKQLTEAHQILASD